jgi:hypothetical protein
MHITQTVNIPSNRRITIDVPCEVPVGKAILTFTPAPVAGAETLQNSDARDKELINRNAERLNREALDVLSFQGLDI